MNFTSIDFETAHANYPCEIGLTKIENGQITNSKSWLIKPACFPYMNPWCQKVHGISAANVANSLTFEEHWSELKMWFEDTTLVAHNAAFDMRVLRAALEYYDLAIPTADYFCSINVSRKTWKHLTSHSLESVCDFHNIRFNHHRAGDDAKACAIIALKAFETIQAQSLEDGLNKLGIVLKKL